MNRLWTPWRLAYVTQASTIPPGCIFCDALASPDEPLVVYRGRSAFVILNKFPYNNGHLMVVPNRHVGRLADLEPDELHELATLTQSAGRAPSVPLTVLRRVIAMLWPPLVAGLGVVYLAAVILVALAVYGVR